MKFSHNQNYPIYPSISYTVIFFIQNYYTLAHFSKQQHNRQAITLSDREIIFLCFNTQECDKTDKKTSIAKRG